MGGAFAVADAWVSAQDEGLQRVGCPAERARPVGHTAIPATQPRGPVIG